MQDTFTITTPDHVELEFEPAGPVSRFGALIIDFSLIFLLLIVVFMAVIGSAAATGAFREASRGGGLLASWTFALVFLLLFIILWGYFVLFELLLNGQTPGKKVMGIRVIRDDGLPVSLRECAIRNLVRAADMVPPPTFVVGGLVAFFDPRGKRLGDMAAGTLVIREDFGVEPKVSHKAGAHWAARLEAGQSRQAVTLPRGKINAGQVGVIQQYMSRRFKLNPARRKELAWKVALPFLELMGEDPERIRTRPDRRDYCETILTSILDQASGKGAKPGGSSQDRDRAERRAEEKEAQWSRFQQRVQTLLGKGRRSLARLSPGELGKLLDDYRIVTSDLARARSMGADRQTMNRLNRLGVAGHNLLYRNIIRLRPAARRGGSWWQAFPKAARRHASAIGLSLAFFFGPALITYFAILWNPGLGYELVSDGFIDFKPASSENLHDIPQLARPIAASAILTNNIQVTLLVFGLGMTAGIGTALILIQNGIHLGAVAGWMALNGNSRALWGWIMPHGGTELLAIVLAGGAGFVLAGAIWAPGRLRRSEALKRVGLSAMTVELGCMAMLVIAGLIEGFVSPSSIGYGARIGVLTISLLAWFSYLGLAGLKKQSG